MSNKITIRPYKGCSNKETYLVSNWLHEDEMSHNMLRRFSNNRYLFVRAKWFKEYLYELALENDISLWRAMPKIGLVNVNWSEVFKKK